MPENLVMAGDYKNCKIQYNEIVLPFFEACHIEKEIEALGYRSIRSDRYIPLNKNFVEAYELIDDVDDKKRDVLNAMWRGGIGQMIFGTAGGVGGALLAKTRDEGYKIVAVQFRNGKQSLIRLDQKAWEQFLADCFCSPDYVPEPIERPKLTRAFQVGRCILSLALLAAIVWGLVKCTTGA